MLKEVRNYLDSLDMSDIDTVKEVAQRCYKWADFTKTDVTIDVMPTSFNTEYDTIIAVAHNFNGFPILIDSWEFLHDIVEMLEEYGETDEKMNDIKEYWTRG